mgnify:CR=1 FL=1
MSHVYIFSYYALTHANEATMTNVFEFPTPEGINENTPMTSGATFYNIIFYAAGNKVYKLDISTGSSTGELVVLQLNAAGKVDDDHKFPSTQIHKGFGKIKDIAFI